MSLFFSGCLNVPQGWCSPGRAGGRSQGGQLGFPDPCWFTEGEQGLPAWLWVSEWVKHVGGGGNFWLTLFFSAETETTNVNLGFFLQNICVLNTSALPRICCCLSLTILDFSAYPFALGRDTLLHCYSLFIPGLLQQILSCIFILSKLLNEKKAEGLISCCSGLYFSRPSCFMSNFLSCPSPVCVWFMQTHIVITSAPAGQGTRIKCFIYLKNDIVLKLCVVLFIAFLALRKLKYKWCSSTH